MTKLLISLGTALLVSACASVPMESKETSERAKNFPPPAAGNAGLYIYRDSHFGAALKKDILLNGKCIGESAPNTFFYEEVLAGKDYKIATESEFSPNEIILTTENGKHHFIRQYIKLGVFVGGANLEIVDNETGKTAIKALDMAKKGTCSQQ